MPVWICGTCGNHYPETASPPSECIICADERQWVPAAGQQWTTAADLAAAGHSSEVRELEPGLTGIGIDPPVAIGQRALLVRTDEGNLLWDPPGFLDEAAVQAVTNKGGLRAVSASHPHFYGAIVEWSHAFSAEILLPEAGALFSGDTIFVTPGEDRVTFVWSAPNRLPLPERAVRGVVESLRDYRFEKIYGGWWRPVLHRDARRVLETSASRYIEFLRGEAPGS